jgi:hypothetical protein
MLRLPKYNTSLLVRVDFSDEAAWARLVEHVARENEDGFRAYVEPIDDREFSAADWPAVKAAVPENDEGASLVFVADLLALSADDHPVLVIDLFSDSPPFRCEADSLWGVENNLNIGNMDWEDFAEHLASDGVFRGF